MKQLWTILMAAILLATLSVGGCDEQESAPTSAPAAKGEALPADAVLDSSPGESTPITQLKQTAKEGDTVTIRAKIGGDVRPFVSGRAVLTVVDATLAQSCGVDPNDPCQTPWDYCCTAPDELRPHMAMVQLVDAEGRPLKVNLEGSPSLKPLDTIVVRGTVGPRPDAATLVVNAPAVYVERAPQ